MTVSPRISLCMIVRDAARTLGACLDSIAPWVDEMIVVDTGSVDDTRSIAQRSGAKVFEFPWCDSFAAARNESLRHAMGDWLFWMDADDTISSDNGRKLQKLAMRPLAHSPTAYVMQVHCPSSADMCDVTVVDHVKMFRNDLKVRFEGRIHEQILPSIRRAEGTVEWTDIFVTHSGAEHTAEARRRKQERDLRLLSLELAEHPDHPFVLFNLGMTYADMDQPHVAAEFLQKCLAVSGPQESHVRKAYALLVGCLTQVNCDEQARKILDRGQGLFNDDPELHFRRGILEGRAKNYDRAIIAYQAALSERGERCFASRDCGITGFKSRHNMACAYWESGRFELAESQWRLALHEQPTFRAAWHALVGCLLDQRKFTTLQAEIESARDIGLPNQEIALAEAHVAASRGQVQAALELVERVIAEDSKLLEPLNLKCRLLFEHGTVEQAIGALEQLCQMCPNDGAAWHNLGTAHHKAKNFAVAVNCYRRSLTLRPDHNITQRQLEIAEQALNAQREESQPGNEGEACVVHCDSQGALDNRPLCAFK